MVGSFGDCPRCLAVCPVGNDYHAHLADPQKAIPEKTPEKVALGKKYREDRAKGAEISGLNDWNIRWVGPTVTREWWRGNCRNSNETQQRRSEAAPAVAGEDGHE